MKDKYYLILLEIRGEKIAVIISNGKCSSSSINCSNKRISCSNSSSNNCSNSRIGCNNGRSNEISDADIKKEYILWIIITKIKV